MGRRLLREICIIQRGASAGSFATIAFLVLFIVAIVTMLFPPLFAGYVQTSATYAIMQAQGIKLPVTEVTSGGQTKPTDRTDIVNQLSLLGADVWDSATSGMPVGGVTLTALVKFLPPGCVPISDTSDIEYVDCIGGPCCMMYTAGAGALCESDPNRDEIYEKLLEAALRYKGLCTINDPYAVIVCFAPDTTTEGLKKIQCGPGDDSSVFNRPRVPGSYTGALYEWGDPEASEFAAIDSMLLNGLLSFER